MLRSLFLTTFISGIMLFSVGVSVALASDADATSNIGFVIYTKSLAPGTLNARWIYGKNFRGPGIATGGSRNSYEGEYHVRYFLENGEFSDEYDLTIEKSGDIYNVSWITDGELSAIGVGMEVENGLAVGWRRVKD